MDSTNAELVHAANAYDLRVVGAPQKCAASSLSDKMSFKYCKSTLLTSCNNSLSMKCKFIKLRTHTYYLWVASASRKFISNLFTWQPTLLIFSIRVTGSSGWEMQLSILWICSRGTTFWGAWIAVADNLLRDHKPYKQEYSYTANPRFRASLACLPGRSRSSSILNTNCSAELCLFLCKVFETVVLRGLETGLLVSNLFVNRVNMVKCCEWNWTLNWEVLSG